MKIFLKILSILTVSSILLACASSDRVEKVTGLTTTADPAATAAETTTSGTDPYLIVLDPGHGFDDPGNVNGFTEENEDYYNLIMTNLVADELESLGAEVIITHDGETYPDIEELAQQVSDLGITFSSSNVVATPDDGLFNPYERVMYTSVINVQQGVDFFLSIHQNSYESDDFSGSQMYFYYDNGYYDIQRAVSESILNAVDYAGTAGDVFELTYDDAYVVVKYGDYPSALLECEFMTNETDAANISNATWREGYAKNVAKGLIEALDAAAED